MRSERIHYLRKYLGGEVKSVVEETFYLKSEEVYAVALLERRYENTFVVAEEYQLIQAFPKIPSTDNKSLRRFLDLLQQILVVMDQIKGLRYLTTVGKTISCLRSYPTGSCKDGQELLLTIKLHTLHLRGLLTLSLERQI